MKKRTSKLLSTLLVLCMVLALLPGTAWAADSGACGDNVTWSLSGSILTIQGTGRMEDFDYYLHYPTNTYYDSRPWSGYRDEIKTVIIENGVTSIGRQAFQDCSALTDVTISGSVTSIGEQAFQACHGLTSVTIPGSVTSIGEAAFNWCRNLTIVTIGKGVTSIGQYAFKNCSALTSVTIPGSVTSIGEAAFYLCDSLTDVYYGGSEEQWEQITIGEWNDPLLGTEIHYNSTGPDVAFTDVAKGQWYYEYVTNAASKGLIKGTSSSENVFAPTSPLTRAAFVTLVDRLVNDGELEDTSYTANWYEPYYAYANAHGLIDGIPADADVNAAIPRYEMAQLLYNSAKARGMDVSASADYTDHDYSYGDSYDTAIRYAYATGLITGRDKPELGFDGVATLNRAEAATVVWRFYLLANG